MRFSSLHVNKGLIIIAIVFGNCHARKIIFFLLMSVNWVVNRRVALIVLLASSVGLQWWSPFGFNILHDFETLKEKLLLPKSDASVELLQISGEIFLLYKQRLGSLYFGDYGCSWRGELDKILVLDWWLNFCFNEDRFLERDNQLLARRSLFEFRAIDHRWV